VRKETKHNLGYIDIPIEEIRKMNIAIVDSPEECTDQLYGRFRITADGIKYDALICPQAGVVTGMKGLCPNCPYGFKEEEE